MKTILETKGQNLDLVPAYSKEWFGILADLFICNPFHVDHDKLMMLREDGFLQDIAQKSEYINKFVSSIQDRDYFSNWYPQKDCHKEMAWHLIDQAKWKI